MLRRLKFVGAFLLVTVSIVFFETRFPEVFIPASTNFVDLHLWGRRKSIEFRSFLVDTPHCKIPDIDPNDPTVIKKRGRIKTVKCTGIPSITYTKGSFLRINWTKVDTYFRSNFSHCEYTPFIRVPFKDSGIKFKRENVKFMKDIIVPFNLEYLYVACFDLRERQISVNYHQIIRLKEKVEKRCEAHFRLHKTINKPKETYNIHLIAIDSISRLDFIRQLPKTRAFLQHDLKTIEMLGYNKVADNTLVNILPLLAGKFYEETNLSLDLVGRLTFDNYSFIWKDFSAAGYRTMYVEDHPKMCAFNYVEKGFRKPPTDYYARPLTLAAADDKMFWSNDHQCAGDRLDMVRWLEYVTAFMRVFRNKPQFGYTFLGRLTHDDPTLLGTADSFYVKFFETLKREGYLENTIMFFFSDHGFRTGSYRETYAGKLEERLPFMFLVLPPGFYRKYPTLVENLKKNSRRLTTPFDIHETLKDILFFDGVDKSANPTDRGISLLREIPLNRSCGSAAILPQWCICLEQTKMDHTSQLARHIAEGFVLQINNILQTVKHLCHALELAHILDLVRMRVDKDEVWFQLEQGKQNKFFPYLDFFAQKPEFLYVYQVIVSTTPGLAKFEATVTYNPEEQKVYLAGDISRINLYGNQSSCIETSSRLRKFCYCRHEE